MLNWFRRKRVPRTLDQLIFDIAEHQRAEDYEEFYSLLPSQRFYVPVERRYAEMVGKRFLVLYTSKDGAGALFSEITGDQAILTVLQSPQADGLLFQNAENSWIALDNAKIRSIAERAGIEATVVVPPEHKVVTYSPGPVPSLARSESGWWILQCGDGRDAGLPIRLIQRFVETAQAENVIWIVSAQFLQSLQDHAFVQRAIEVARSSAGKIAHTAVFPPACDRRVMETFKDAGFGVHLPGPDDVCFIEVHRPDGIIVGMAGPALERAP